MAASSTDEELPVRDPDSQRRIPSAWRPTFEAIVRRLRAGNYSLTELANVRLGTEGAARQMEAYFRDFGQSLIDLPPDTWTTSATQWMGAYWDALIDLWTAESGRSDLALSVRVFERAGTFEYVVFGAYVP